MNDCRTLAEDNIAFLRQASSLLERIDDAVFTRGNSATLSSGFGPHLRHCLDHYEQFLAGFPAGHIDYDARERDRRTETDRAFALQRIRPAIGGLGKISAEDADRPLEIKMDSGGAQEWTKSTAARELQFLASHTVHHFALIAFILRSQRIDTGPEFGIAPSTLRHQKSPEPCAR